MASVGVAPAGAREPSGHAAGVDKLPEEMNDMKIRDDKVCIIWIYVKYFVTLMVSVYSYVLVIKCLPGQMLKNLPLCCRKWKPLSLMVTGQKQGI